MFPANTTCFVKNKTSFDKKRKHVPMFFLIKNQMTEMRLRKLYLQTHKKCMTYITENFKTNAFSEYQSIDVQTFIEK